MDLINGKYHIILTCSLRDLKHESESEGLQSEEDNTRPVMSNLGAPPRIK